MSRVPMCAACEARRTVQDSDATFQRASDPTGDPKCSFPMGRAFNHDGWNCATANMIRDICTYERGPAIDHRCFNDQHYATIDVARISLPSGEALSLWLSWYKQRGRTEAMWLLSEVGRINHPTEEDILAIVAAMKKQGYGTQRVL